MSRLVTFAALFLTLGISSSAATPKRARNVILLLADAGGVATVNAASLLGYGAPLKLFVQSWPHVGLSDTTPAGAWVSDSAAGMTALVTGAKTRNGVISQSADAERGKKDGAPLKTILEYAEERGLSTGVLSNVTITDATPAACYAHANDRRNWGEIFLQLYTPRYGNGVDVLFGPGRKRIWEEAAKIGASIDDVAKAKGRPVLTSLDQAEEASGRGLVVVDGAIDLDAAAKKAVRMLSRNRKGFFLMIESDAHTDDPEAGLTRLVRFDKLIRELSTMVDMRETLFVFTADHSFDLRVTGGRPGEPLLKGLTEWKEKNPKGGGMRLPYVRVDGSHTAEEVIVAATGPGAERVRGFMPNTRVFEILMAAYGWRATAQ